MNAPDLVERRLLPSSRSGDGGARRRRLSILAPTRYSWRFNGPRRSCHDVTRRAFVPFNRISPKIEGITTSATISPARGDAWPSRSPRRRWRLACLSSSISYRPWRSAAASGRIRQIEASSGLNLALLDLLNVRWVPHSSNRDVRDLFRASHLSLLTTLGDTCGFSAIESMAEGTPVIATAQGALPELIDHGINGFLLPIPADERREWVHLGDPDRGSTRFEALFTDAIEGLARRTFAILEALVETPDRLTSLRDRAYEDAKLKFSAGEATLFWDEYYENVVDQQS